MLSPRLDVGRAMELGRECLQIWGYKRVDELIWVKTNQLQRLIRTGRTGHWLNHSKEHCLVGVKGNPQINRNLDCDVLVAEVCLYSNSCLGSSKSSLDGMRSAACLQHAGCLLLCSGVVRQSVYVLACCRQSGWHN